MADGTGTDPVNYSKDNHQVVLDDHDRSKNNPTAVTGYEIALQPEGNWPGLASSGEVHFNPPDMTSVVATLQSLRGVVAGVPASLAKPTEALSFGHTSWQEAGDLQRAQQIVSETVRLYSDKLIQNLDKAMEHIGQSAVRLTEAENAAEHGTRSPGANITGGA